MCLESPPVRAKNSRRVFPRDPQADSRANTTGSRRDREASDLDLNWRDKKSAPPRTRTRSGREWVEPRKDNFRAPPNELPPRLRKKAEADERERRNRHQANGVDNDFRFDDFDRSDNDEDSKFVANRNRNNPMSESRSLPEDWDGTETPPKRVTSSSTNWDKAPGSNRKQTGSSSKNRQGAPLMQGSVTSHDRMNESTNAKSDDYNMWGSSSLGRGARRWGDWGTDESWDPAHSAGDSLFESSPHARTHASILDSRSTPGDDTDHTTAHSVREVQPLLQLQQTSIVTIGFL